MRFAFPLYFGILIKKAARAIAGLRSIFKREESPDTKGHDDR